MFQLAVRSSKLFVREFQHKASSRLYFDPCKPTYATKRKKKILVVKIDCTVGLESVKDIYLPLCAL